ncbi:Clp protease N-terminal domain-containing protein [Streptomyces angustmyceticus]|uniref:Peptidase n=1 Tax=Streptomyces angustmyceticus TaxID=285578 RepID=A0A5J4LGF7_9ACTN|nr:Clp protease N-terminal domain-containing protein [Streptomyces angustmyceticus]UAL67147.1 Clp protease N-terminal domain-containing protein [Streptomyces angustmyceticus]GES30566.1 peptidase [Streptomyces angustmyceticus]
MFEKFTAGARAVVRGAAEQADRTGSGTVGEPELLLALLDRRDSPAAAVLGALGVHERRASVVDALATVRRRGGVSTADAAALAGLGIDVDAVVARVERQHGVGALAADGRAGRRGRLRRPFTAEAKSVLERALRIAVGRGERCLGDEHLLLALAAGRGPAAAVLADHGVTHGEVVRVLEESRGRRAS